MTIDPERFGLIKKELITNWRNFASERPYTQAFSALRTTFNNQQFAPQQLADALEPLSAASLASWRDKVLTKVGVTGLLHGSVDETRVTELRRSLTKRLNLANVAATDPLIMPLEGVGTKTVNVDHDDSATVIYVQGDNETTAEQARYGLLSQLIRSSYFTALRTEAQLGYVVAATNGRMYKTPGLVFIVQSPVASSAQVFAATREFVDGYINELANMPAAEFAAAKAGFLNELREKDKNQHGRAGRYWNDLQLGVTTFDRSEQIAQAVEKLDQPAMQQLVEDLRGSLDTAYFLVTSPGKFGATSDSATAKAAQASGTR